MSFQTVPLGKTGISIPPMGIGAWSWGDRMFWNYGRGYGKADTQAAFEACLRAGVNFFDTAEVYGLGESERLLGQFLRAARKEAVVATKFFPFPFRLTKGGLRRALQASLRRLDLPRVDLYQIHQPFPPVPVSTWMAAMADAVQAGLIRAVGVSNYDPEKTRRAHRALAGHGIPLASNQVHYSLMHREPERSGLKDLCAELGVTLIAYSPLEMGLLSGKYTPSNPPPGFRGRRFSKDLLAALQPLVRLMREIGQGHGGRTATQVAINWVIGKGAVPIPGPKNERQALDNLASLEWSLTNGEMAALDEASGRISQR